MEAQAKNITGVLRELSVQQLVDCSGDYGNFRCAGGYMCNSFNYSSDHYIAYESDYPYAAIVSEVFEFVV